MSLQPKIRMSSEILIYKFQASAQFLGMRTLIALIVFAVGSLLAQDSSKKPMQAEMLRSTSGRTLGANGFANGTMQLKKGMIFPVVEQRMGFVVMDVNGKKVVVAGSEVSLTERADAPPAVSPGEFQPGQILLISAKYTVEGNQPRNVKNRLDKLIPKGVITEPVSIMVTDALSSMAETQGNVITGIITDTAGGAVVQLQKPRKNILTVQYSFNGQTRMKQVPEGEYLVLP
jgi:hypothetical protein